MRREVRGLRLPRLACLGFACALALAAQAQWPPSEEAAARMLELQATMHDPAATPVQREAAREELSKMLKSPAGREHGRTPGEKPVHPPRAAIEPFGSIVKPAANPAITVPGVARTDVVVPPKPFVIPQTGSVVTPSNGAAVDPRTGHVLHETPYGYVDPRTGQFVPR